MPSEKRARQRAMREMKVAEQARRERRAKTLRRGLAALVVVGLVIGAVVLLSGGSSKAPTPSSSTSTSTSTSTSSTLPGTPTTAPVSKAAIAPTCPPATAAGARKRVIAFTSAPPMCISAHARYLATVRTDVGTFVITLPAAASPAAVNNFVFLARYHFYDLTVFRRVIPGFVVQGGDPTETGAGGPGYSFTGNTPPASCATSHTCYPVGTVAMANSGSPSSDGSQFFVVVGAQGTQLPPSYTRFGTVTKGMSVVNKIAADGNTVPADNGVPPKVLHHIISVTISQAGA